MRVTSSFANNQYYRESCQHGSQRPVFFGRKKHLLVYCNDLEGQTKKEDSQYYGCVFFPWWKNPSYIFSYEDHKAFWAGLIDAQRTLILKTDLANEDDSKALKFGYTCDEILWLIDNGYFFEPNQDNFNETIARPCPHYNQQHYLKDYRDQNCKIGQFKSERCQRFNQLRGEVLNHRLSMQPKGKYTTEESKKRPLSPEHEENFNDRESKRSKESPSLTT